MNPDEPKPEVKATDSKPDPAAAEPEVKAAVPPAEAKTEPKPLVKADPKAVALTRDTKAAEPTPEAKAEPKTGIKPASKPGAKAASKPEAKADETKNGTKAAAPKTTMANKIIFTLAVIGILAGLVAAYIFGMQRKAQPPVFKPVSNPYESAIYANGMIESDLPSGENINIFPEVSGPITKVLVQEGQTVKAGTLLFTIEDSVKRANTELAAANLKQARDQYDKDRASYQMDPKSISKDVLDTAEDTVNQATAALKAANALLRYYSVKAPVDGVVLAVNATVGGYVSPQGDYDTYTELFDPLVIMSGPQGLSNLFKAKAVNREVTGRVTPHSPGNVLKVAWHCEN